MWRDCREIKGDLSVLCANSGALVFRWSSRVVTRVPWRRKLTGNDRRVVWIIVCLNRHVSDYVSLSISFSFSLYAFEILIFGMFVRYRPISFHKVLICATTVAWIRYRGKRTSRMSAIRENGSVNEYVGIERAFSARENGSAGVVLHSATLKEKQVSSNSLPTKLFHRTNLSHLFFFHSFIQR